MGLRHQNLCFWSELFHYKPCDAIELRFMENDVMKILSIQENVIKVQGNYVGLQRGKNMPKLIPPLLPQ